jgi:hypothetical protein
MNDHDFRYDEPAQALDDKLEEVLDSHQKERQEEAEKEAEALPAEPSALQRIAEGRLPSTEVELFAEQSQKKASALIAEHQVRTMLREGTESRAAAIDDFITQAEES